MTVFMLLFLSAVLPSCNEKEEIATKLVAVTEGDVTVGWEGGTCRFLYEIENPTPAGVVNPTTEAEWITDFDYLSDYGEIIIVVAENPDHESRTAAVKVEYEGQSLSFNVVQAGKDEMGNSHLKIEIDSVRTTSVHVTVTPADNSLTYLVLSSDMASMAGFEDDDVLFEDAMSYYQDMADYYNQSLEDVLASYLLTGPYDDTFSDLEPNTEYCVFAFGVSVDGSEMLTPIARASVTTKQIDGVSVSFTFDINTRLKSSGTGALSEISIKPSDTEVKYWYAHLTQTDYDIYGQSMPEAVEGYLRWTLNYYYYSGMTYEDIYNAFSCSGNVNPEYTLDCNYRYWIAAFAWDEECNITSDIAWEEYRAPGIESDNKITISMTETTSTSVVFDVSTTNDDPYVMLCEPLYRVEGMDDEYLMWSLVDYYDFTEAIFNGGLTGVTYSDLEPSTDYVILAFGYDGGSWSTGLTRYDFTTKDPGDAADVTFDVSILNLKPTSVDISVVPSDPGVYYYYDLFPGDWTEDDVRKHFESDMESQLASGSVSSPQEYWEYTATLIGNDYWTYSVVSGNSYVVGIVVPDMETGTVATTQVSEPFTVPEPVMSDEECIMDCTKYYDGDELYAYDPVAYQSLQGKALLIPKPVLTEGVAHYYYTIVPWNDVYDDESKYTDEGFIRQLTGGLGQVDLENGQWSCQYDKEYFLMSVAEDANGNYGKLYRHRFILTKDGASPIDEIVGTSAGQAVRTVEVGDAGLAPVAENVRAGVRR